MVAVHAGSNEVEYVSNASTSDELRIEGSGDDCNERMVFECCSNEFDELKKEERLLSEQLCTKPLDRQTAEELLEIRSIIKGYSDYIFSLNQYSDSELYLMNYSDSQIDAIRHFDGSEELIQAAAARIIGVYYVNGYSQRDFFVEWFSIY